MLHAIVLVTAWVAGALSSAPAQTFGSLAGTVTDPLGGFLPGAHVALVQSERQTRYEVTTDRSGRFEMVGLVTGDYQLGIQVAGFEPYRASVTINAGANQQSAILAIGRLHETIRVVETTEPPPAPRQASAYTEPPCPAASGAAGNIGGNLRAPSKLRDAKPAYPASLRGTGRDVTMVVDAKIGLDGYLKDFEPRQPYQPDVYATLVPALQLWRFSATLLNCVPQEVPMTITVLFAHQ